MLVPFLGTGATAVPIERACLRDEEYKHKKMPQAPKNFEGVFRWMVNLIHIWTGDRDGTIYLSIYLSIYPGADGRLHVGIQTIYLSIYRMEALFPPFWGSVFPHF